MALYQPVTAGGTFRSMWGFSCADRSETSQWRVRKRSSPTDDKHDLDLISKRFASEELVTAHFRELHISPPNPHTLTHPLVVTAITDCPGLVDSSHTNGYVTESNGCGLESCDSTPWQRDAMLTRGSSPLQLIEDTSGGVWPREGTCPPVYPIRAQQDLNTSWESHVLLPEPSPALTNQIAVEPEESMTVAENQDDVINIRDSPSTSEKTPNKRSLSCPWVSWRPVTINDVSSDSSESSGDEPERPLSMWIAPELIQCARRHSKALPQSLLDKYNSPVGMEVVVWVDPTTRLTAGCGGIRPVDGEMQDMTEPSEDRQLVDMN